MKIKWNIDDGYVNRRPDWELEIDDEELEKLTEGMTAEEVEEYIEECVEEAFRQTVTFSYVKVEE